MSVYRFIKDENEPLTWWVGADDMDGVYCYIPTRPAQLTGDDIERITKNMKINYNVVMFTEIFKCSLSHIGIKFDDEADEAEFLLKYSDNELEIQHKD